MRHGCWPAVLGLLALLLPLAEGATTTGGPLADEGAIMQRLRQSIHDADAAWSAGWAGWSPGNRAHHCTWAHVGCNSAHKVTGLVLAASVLVMAPLAAARNGTSASRPSCGSHPGPLLPHMAQLQWLENLRVEHYPLALAAHIPAEWGQPGAFPRLTSLSLSVLAVCPPLPDILPGALPLLVGLALDMYGLHATLPASWGSSPHTLPALQALTMQARWVGPLPLEWAAGFLQLQQLIVTDSQYKLPTAAWTPATLASWDAADAQQAVERSSSTTLDGGCNVTDPDVQPRPLEPMRLPAEWAAGFPRLHHLDLGSPSLTGTIPQEWLAGFPALTELSLDYSALSGTLPEHLFWGHPLLTHLTLVSNNFTGTLPGAWGASGVHELILAGNDLTGPAFPPAWLQPGALLSLESLDLSRNARLTGTLPASLAWPQLVRLELDGTGVSGSIPHQWCSAFPHMEHVSVNHTAVDPAPPPCVLGDYGATFDLHQSLLEDARPGAAPKLQSQQRQAVGVAGVATLVFIAAVAAAGSVSGLLWWRRRRQHAFTRHAPGSECTLLPQPPQQQQEERRGGGAEGGEESVGLLPTAAGIFAARNTRARLSSLLGAELSKHGTGASIPLLPLEALPAALAHSLVALSMSAAAGGSRNPLPLLAAEGSSALLSEGRRSKLAGPESTRLTSGDSGGSCRAPGSSPPGGRQWGLPTDSLRVAPGELQFLHDPDGSVLELGQGSNAMVYRAKLDGRQAAVKVFQLEAGMQSTCVWREVLMMRQCTHPRIVPLYGVAVQGQLLMIAMQFMAGGSLQAILAQPDMRRRLQWQLGGWRVAVDVAEALDYLHTQLRVMHSDLKAGNVLLSPDGRASIADLGIALVLSTRARTAAGYTRVYAAPEQLMGQRCTLAADV